MTIQRDLFIPLQVVNRLLFFFDLDLIEAWGLGT